MEKPVVSIIIPCYNQEQYLEECLQSVLKQTFPEWECIIVNDGSTDKTELTAKKWFEKDPRFVYVYKENGGLSSARNSGLKIAKGDYIQFLDCDDCIDAHKFRKSIDLLDKNSEINVVVSNYKRFTTNLSKAVRVNYFLIRQDFLNFENVLLKWDNDFAIPIHCGFFRADFFRDFRFNEVLRAKEDWIMWIAFFSKNNKAVFLDEDLAFYRINQQSMTNSKDIFPDYLNSILYLKTILSQENFEQLLLQIIKRQDEANKRLRKEGAQLKNSGFYKMVDFYKRVKLKLDKILKRK
jgi:glycosyltransferase involved in cell wall biosynthesis